jgi:hypothetical protein
MTFEETQTGHLMSLDVWRLISEIAMKSWNTAPHKVWAEQWCANKADYMIAQYGIDKGISYQEARAAFA